MGHPATAIRFKRTSPEEARIYLGEKCVGDVCAHDDILRPGHRCFVVHLDEDPRGPRRVHDRCQVRATAQRMVDTLWWR